MSPGGRHLLLGYSKVPVAGLHVLSLLCPRKSNTLMILNIERVNMIAVAAKISHIMSNFLIELQVIRERPYPWILRSMKVHMLIQMK